MKKKLIAVIVTVILVFSLSVSAVAANGAGNSAGNGSSTTTGNTSGSGAGQNGAGATAEDRGAQIQARERIMTCFSAMTQNRAAILSCRDDNLQLATQLRIVLQELKDCGATLPEATLDDLIALKTELADLHDQLADTKGDIQTLMDLYRDYREAGDLESAEAVLNQVIEIQETRIALSEEIAAVTQQILDILSTVDTTAA